MRQSLIMRNRFHGFFVLKYLDDLETDRESKALLTGETYEPLLDEESRWKSWTYPKDEKGDLLKTATVGDDLIAFVSGDLFPYLAGFKGYAEKGTNPLNDDDLKKFVEFQASFKESERSWFLDLKDIE